MGAGDLLLFKRAAGAVCATAKVDAVEFHDLRYGTASELRERCGRALCADDQFWEERADARYATLMHLGDIREVPELYLDKHDRRGWVVLEDGPRVHVDQLQISGLARGHASAVRVVVVFPSWLGQNPAQLILPGLQG